MGRATDIPIGARVRFPPNPRWRDRTVEATVIGYRKRPNANTLSGTWGFVETRDDQGKERSTTAAVCEIVAPPRPEEGSKS